MFSQAIKVWTENKQISFNNIGELQFGKKEKKKKKDNKLKNCKKKKLF